MFLEVEEGGLDQDEEAEIVYLIRFIARFTTMLLYGWRD